MSLDTRPCYECTDPLGTARADLVRLAPSHHPLTAIDAYGPNLHVACGDTPCLPPDTQIFLFTFDDGITLPIIVVCPPLVGAVCNVVDHYGQPF